MGELERLNPRIRKATIGVRTLYDITIYPLSFGDELRFLERVTMSLSQFVMLPPEERTDMVLASILSEFVKESFPEILSLVIDMEEWNTISGNKDIMMSMDNYQLLEIAQIIYDVNFGEQFQKKAQTMAQEFMKVWQNKGTMTQQLN